MASKKSQTQITFHWVYILIAGGLILLFFAGLAIKGKEKMEKSLQEEVSRILEAIFLRAGTAENTKFEIEVSGLSDYTLEFNCQEGTSIFGLKGGFTREVPLIPLFAPREIKTTKLLLWSLPYRLPYKIIDLLLISSFNTKYFVLGEGEFKVVLEKAVLGDKTKFNFEFITDTQNIEPGHNFQIRIIDLDGSYPFTEVPPSLKKLADEKVTGLQFQGGKAHYYKKEGASWKKEDSVSLISLGGERDPAKYAAIFAANGESYRCNFMKVFKRMELINEIYSEKLNEIISYYNQTDPSGKCLLILQNQEKNLKKTFDDLKIKTSFCSEDFSSCPYLLISAQQLRKLNSEGPEDSDDLQDNGCLTLY